MGLVYGPELQKADASIDEDWVKSGSRVYTVGFTTDCDENYVRSNLGSTFVLNYPHPSDNSQVITNISVTQNEDGEAVYTDGTPIYVWNATITYGTWNPLDHTINGDPTLIPITWSFDTEVYQVAADTAIVGYNSDGSPQYGPVVNSSGCLFDPPVTRDQCRIIMTFTQRVLTCQPYYIFRYGNYLNSTPWNSFPAFSVRLFPPTVPEREWSQVLQKTYYTLSYRFVFNPDSWIEQIIDRGTTYIDESGNQYPILTLQGNSVTEPQLLNGMGGVLLNPTYENISIKNFQTYPSVDFNSVFPQFSGLTF